jgi:hypothetical protein
VKRYGENCVQVGASPYHLGVVSCAGRGRCERASRADSRPLSPDAPKPQKRRLPNPPPDNSDVKLPSFSLEIKAEEATVAVGEKLKVEVIITNTSDEEDMLCDGSGHIPEFRLEVHDETEKDDAPIPGSVVVTQGSSFAARLHPGESIRRFARLDKEFKLDKPGDHNHSVKGALPLAPMSAASYQKRHLIRTENVSDSYQGLHSCVP